MNHDDKKPNSEMRAWIEPELEARVVAWVAGEASAFEVAELERLLVEKPELAIFKRRIEAVQGLVAEAVRPDREPLRLSPERRAKLQQTIGKAEKPAPAAKPATSKVVPFATARQMYWIYLQRLSMIAAGLIVGLTILSGVRYVMFPSFRLSSTVSEPKNLALSMPVAFPDNQRSELRQERRLLEDKARADASAVAAVRAEQLDIGAKRRAPRGQFAAELVAGASDEPEPVLASPAPAPTVGGLGGEQVVEMSPFEVTAESNRGYMASSVIAGSRFSTTIDPPQIASSSFSGGAGDATLARRANRRPTAPNNFSAGSGGRTVTLGETQPTINDAASTQTLNYGAMPSSETTFGVRQRGLSANVADVTLGSVAAADADNWFFDGQRPTRPTPDQIVLGPNTNSYGDLAQLDGNRTAGIAGKKTTAETVASDASTIELSPFKVDSSKDKGTFAANNTLSGSRLNTQIAYAADSITVVTKQQMRDTGSVDISDVFRKEANLEGTTQRAEIVEKAKAKLEADQRRDQDRPLPAAPHPVPPPPTTAETSATKEPVSTFSLHVSDVSFRLAQAALARGEAPDPDRIRPEEFYNAFNYGDPAPATGEKITCRIEQAVHPVLQQRNLVRIAMKVAATGRGAGTPLRLTVLLDTSGSMEREDRAATVRRAMEVLVSLLGPNDRITLIGFARQPRLLADQLPGDQARQVLDIIARTPAEGGTNIEEALKLGGELARRHLTPQAQNRIVLLTDGAANLGNAIPAQLAAQVEALRQQGIAFDACGVGLDGLDDAMLEALTRQGDGRYYVLDTPEAADAGFARQLAGAFRPAAENVKVQVRFNPARVGNYRLIGFEQHRLREEDFRNDKVDAAELAAEEAAVALYQIEALPQGDGELGEVFVRFRDPATGTMIERSWTMTYDPSVRPFDRATPTMQLAGMAALLAEKLRGGALAEQIKLSDFAPVINTLRSHYAQEARVQELATMFEQMRRLKKE
jgi:secreted protein with Ig-like and vWFA domain